MGTKKIMGLSFSPENSQIFLQVRLFSLEPSHIFSTAISITKYHMKTCIMYYHNGLLQEIHLHYHNDEF